MSTSNAAAIRRRATPQNNTPTPQPGVPTSQNRTPTSQNNKSSQLTINQAIVLITNRLTALENQTTNTSVQDDNLPMIVEEFNNRFELIVNELNNIKDTVMKLQTYTMEVNKMLVDERIHVLSDLENVDHVTENTLVDTDDNNENLKSTDIIEE
jgi:hypothetical protein